MVKFLFVVIELFRYLLRLRRYKRKSVEVGVFRRGWVTFGEDFGWKGTILSNSVRAERLQISFFVWCLDIDRRLFRFVTIHTSNRETDRIAKEIRRVALHAVARKNALVCLLYMVWWINDIFVSLYVLPERDYVTFRFFLSQIRLSSFGKSVTLVHPTHEVEPFGNISSPLCTLATTDLHIKYYGDCPSEIPLSEVLNVRGW